MKPDLSKLRNKKICVAVSGGRDSMALLHYLNSHAEEYGITLTALNCDHGIRGEESEKDSRFVIGYCKKADVPLLFFKWETDEVRTETSAREWRLRCYASAVNGSWRGKAGLYICKRSWEKPDCVATAHHLDDNAETVLFNLARGSALSGLTGICDGDITVHPLVCVSRSEIDEYIKYNCVPYVDDATNDGDLYTRNKIRHNVLPELEKAVSGASKAIYRFSRLACDDEEYFARLIEKLDLIKITPAGAKIRLCEERVVFKRAVLKVLKDRNVKDYTSDHADSLYSLQFAENGKRFEFLGLTAYREEDGIFLSFNSGPVTVGSVPFYSYIERNSEIFGGQLLKFTQNDEIPDNYSGVKGLRMDKSRLPETAVIRFMCAGDKFTKFGGGTKKLGDYFTDKKIPVRIRRNIPVIADGNEILVVCGVEISDKVKLDGRNENALYCVCADYSSGKLN